MRSDSIPASVHRPSGHRCHFLLGLPRSGSTLLVRYESLTRDPQAAMKEVYGFLGEPTFAHDFENIEYDNRGFDAKAGPPGCTQ